MSLTTRVRSPSLFDRRKAAVRVAHHGLGLCARHGHRDLIRAGDAAVVTLGVRSRGARAQGGIARIVVSNEAAREVFERGIIRYFVDGSSLIGIGGVGGA